MKIKTPKKTRPAVAVVMGSQSDWEVMKEACKALKDFKIPFEKKILSAHRTPVETADYATQARKNGVSIFIAGAGGAAHLPGMIAAYTELPVIGVPVPSKAVQGLDALFSIVQMPKGIPVATVAIGNAFNAGLLAVQILAVSNPQMMDQIQTYKQSLRKKVKKQKLS